MSYHPLSNDTGGSADDRVGEALRLLEIIAEVAIELTPKESAFVESMNECTTCSPKQLFWLRDIKDKDL